MPRIGMLLGFCTIRAASGPRPSRGAARISACNKRPYSSRPGPESTRGGEKGLDEASVRRFKLIPAVCSELYPAGAGLFRADACEMRTSIHDRAGLAREGVHPDRVLVAGGVFHSAKETMSV